LKEFWIEDVPINDDVLNLIMSHGVNEVEQIILRNCDVTNEIIKHIVEKIKERNEQVKTLLWKLH